MCVVVVRDIGEKILLPSVAEARGDLRASQGCGCGEHEKDGDGSSRACKWRDRKAKASLTIAACKSEPSHGSCSQPYAGMAGMMCFMVSLRRIFMFRRSKTVDSALDMEGSCGR